MNLQAPKAPDAKDGMDRTIHFTYDINQQGHTAWLIDRISQNEERRTRICFRRDGDGDVESLIKKLESWGVFIRETARIGGWENTYGGGYYSLHDTPKVRELLGQINTDAGPLQDALIAAWDAVFKAGFYPIICASKANGDIENMRMRPHNQIRVGK